MQQLSRKFQSFYTKKARYKIAYGGRGGGKSYAIAIILLLLGTENKLLIACLREVLKTLDGSVHRLLSNIILQNKPLSSFYTIQRDRIIGKNGTEFIYAGMTDASKFKSFEGIDIAWIEEAAQLSEESMRVLIPTIRKTGSELWFSFNPDSEEDAVYKFITQPRDNQILVNINYTDNTLCSQELLTEAEYLKSIDYEMYKHVWLGECYKMSDAVIFKNRFEVRDFEIENYFGIPRMGGEVLDMYYGLDFGFVHPCCMIETFIYNGCIYISNEIVAQEMQTDDITVRYLNEFTWNKNKIIYADCADPLQIEQLKYARYHNKTGMHIPALNIEPAKKGQGSVEAGINWLKNHKNIFIHSRCIYTINNFKKYSYKKLKDGTITATINKINDDCIDALRYAYTPLIGENTLGIDWGNTENLKELLQDYHNPYYDNYT